MQLQLQAARDQVERVAKEVTGLRSRVELFDARFDDVEEKVGARGADKGGGAHIDRLDAKVAIVEEAMSEVAAITDRIRDIEASLIGRAEIDTLAARVDVLASRLDATEKKASVDEREALEVLRTRVASVDARAGQLDRLLADLSAREAMLTERLKRFEQMIEERDRRIEALEAALASGAARASARPAAANPPAGGDDLRKIKGIGPKFDAALRAIGVSTYAQIAAWTEDDLTRIADQIGAKPERIARERWIEKARELSAK